MGKKLWMLYSIHKEEKMNEQCMYCMQDTAGNHEYDCPMHPRHWEKRTYHMGSPHIVPKVFRNIMLKKGD